MSETPEQPTPEEKFKISIQITESLTGDLGLQVLGEKVKLSDVRKLLTWALYRVNDEISAELAKNILEDKLKSNIKANGFRKLPILNLFTK